jgi:hypothetical protein
MGKMKELVMDMEEKFWDECSDRVGGCERLDDFISEISEHRHLLPLHSDNEFLEIITEAWNDYWQEKGHE